MNTAPSQTPGGIAVFVRRPILAFVISALILIAGLASLLGAEIRELPNVDRPVVTVTTTFRGASPEAVDQEITGRIENAVSRVSGIKSMSASSRFGRSRITIEFREDVDIDVAATDIRDAVARISGEFPEDTDDPQIVKADADSQPVMRIAVTSASRAPQELTRLVRDRVEARLLAVPGVADLQVYGDREAIFRVDVDQKELASRGLSLADLGRVLQDAAFDSPAGDLSGDRQSLNVRTTAALQSPEAFMDLRLSDNVVLGDVARVTMGPTRTGTYLRANGQTGLGMGVIRQSTSNTLEISRGVHETVADLQASLPEDVSIFVTSDDARFINGAISEVVNTLLIAVAIVVAVIFLFLRSARATMVPALTMPVSLIGTLAAVWLVGFSINILTLLALVLATGMVVDDAIVVLENIVRRRSQGMGPRAAAVIGTREVFFAVVTTTATLAAVFIPLSFLPGQAGGLFREFGFTLAMSVTLSSIVALTLCPVLASRLLTSDPDPDPRGPMVWLGNRLAGFYAFTLRGALAVPLAMVVAAGLFALTSWFIGSTIKQELTPREDRAVALMSIRTPQGVSADYTIAKMQELEDALASMRDTGEVTNIFSFAGYRGNNAGFMVLTLAGWDERDRSQQEIVSEIYRRIGPVIGVRAFVIQPNSLRIRGAGRGLSFAIAGDNYNQLADVSEALVQKMQENPQFGRVQLEYETTQPQLFVQIDRIRASDLGIDISGLGTALRALLDGRAVGEVFINDDSFEIQLMSTTDPIDDPTDLQNIFVRGSDGQMVPMASFVSLEERAIAPELNRESQRRSVEISASLAPDMALGDALAEVERLADGILAENNDIVPLAEAATLNETNAGMFMTFGFAILVVLLVLAAQFESFVSAVVVMATVPLGLACAMIALSLTGLSLNVYSQIGLVMLIGIMAKNGILIVEFANQLRDQGSSVYDAILNASTIRLRPVMMTMISTVLGGVPLILSSGAGAEAREALGWVIVGGLGLATLSTLYITPVAYLLLARFSKPRAIENERLMQELGAAAKSA